MKKGLFKNFCSRLGTLSCISIGKILLSNTSDTGLYLPQPPWVTGHI
jgi:hypothetical protein